VGGGDAALAGCRTQEESALFEVEVLDGLGAHASDLQPSDGRADVLLDLPDVAGARGLLDVDDFQPAVEQLVDGRLGRGAAALIDLVQQLRDDLLRLAFGLALRGTGLDGLAEPDLLPREPVDAEVDLHALDSFV
jgi:hypothetical protein